MAIDPKTWEATHDMGLEDSFSSVPMADLETERRIVEKKISLNSSTMNNCLSPNWPNAIGSGLTLPSTQQMHIDKDGIAWTTLYIASTTNGGWIIKFGAETFAVTDAEKLPEVILAAVARQKMTG